jgi:hypothetical protein
MFAYTRVIPFSDRSPLVAISRSDAIMACWSNGPGRKEASSHERTSSLPFRSAASAAGVIEYLC